MDVCAVFDMDRIPKYAVVMVPMAVNAEEAMDTISAPLLPLLVTCTTAKIAARAMATSPNMTTKSPVQARTLRTLPSAGSVEVDPLPGSEVFPDPVVGAGAFVLTAVAGQWFSLVPIRSLTGSIGGVRNTKSDWFVARSLSGCHLVVAQTDKSAALKAEATGSSPVDEATPP